VVWSIVIAGLPLFILLVGYHRWRKICPLAFFSQIPVYLRRPGTRKASPWLEEHYYYIMFGVLAFALWLRLVAINGNTVALASFFVLISIVALIFGALFTGKTWCNYFCPVSLIEKINSEPHGLRETNNSQCVKCTACKKSCPDINQENGYWKEIGLRSKRFAYYAFPGLTFSFFLYYYLQSGDWNYYFTGNWADQESLMYRVFSPGYNQWTAGFFFFEGMPRAVSAVLTLVAGSLAGFALFSKLEPSAERWLKRQQPDADATQARHLMFTIAAFVAFVNFYVFAGQPLLRLVPWLGTLGPIFAAAVGSLYLARRYSRTQKAFAEQTLALNVVKRWEWEDTRPPKDLHEAFLIHTARSAERKTGYAQVLQAYQDAVRETLADGFATREDVQRLESLRNQLQIKKADHEKLMATLAEEERSILADPSRQPSAEKRLQLETYRRALEQHLKLALAAKGADDTFLKQLRSEYNVTEEEHAAQLRSLLGGTQEIAAQVAEKLREVARCAETIQALEAEPAPSHALLADILRRKREWAADLLVGALHLDVGEAGRIVREGLCGSDGALRESAFDTIRARVPAVSEQLLAVQPEAPREGMGGRTLTDQLRGHTESADPYVRAAALYALAERGELDLNTLHRLSEDEHELVRETLNGLTQRMGSKAGASDERFRLTRLEKMIALRSVPWFASLGPESLAELSRHAVEDYYTPGDVLAREQEEGDTAFIILSGEVVVLHKADTDGHEVEIDRGPAGTVSGDMAVLDPAPRSATLRAGEAGVRVLSLEGSAFRDALAADPAVAHGVIRTLAQRIRGLVQRVGA
ncbi:MAG TPA: cyclic nucleotide-binding domain-containing protein, partial [Bryobacteraceae bacterium]|nr:cyclic nucleotide-binding domain-containing protein [Bryobacteraceae bacterium]